MIKDAIVMRLQNICRERGIRYNELATRSGVTPSTIYSLMSETRRDLSVITLKKLCDGLDMTTTDFLKMICSEHWSRKCGRRLFG